MLATQTAELFYSKPLDNTCVMRDIRVIQICLEDAMADQPRKEKKVFYPLRLDPSVVEEIKILAEKVDLPPGTFARNLLMNGLDDARALDKVGLLRLFGMTRKQIDKTLKKLGLTLDGLDVLNED